MNIGFGFNSRAAIAANSVVGVPSTGDVVVPCLADALIVGSECAPFFYLRSIRIGNRVIDLNAPASAFSDRLCDSCGVERRRKAELELSKILILPGHQFWIEVENTGPLGRSFLAWLRCVGAALQIQDPPRSLGMGPARALCRQCGIEGLAEESPPTDEERARRAYLNARKMLAGLSPEARARVLDGVPHDRR